LDIARTDVQFELSKLLKLLKLIYPVELAITYT
jgi:hypothetical protein